MILDNKAFMPEGLDWKVEDRNILGPLFHIANLFTW
jgi:hypothetical protein